MSAISGSIFKEISNIIDQPTKAVDLLANSLPAQAIYFVQILLVTTFLGIGFELLRVSYLAMAFLRSKVGPNLTEKERNTTWMGIRPLADPYQFLFGIVLGKAILYFMVSFVYATMAPITNYFLALCYALLSVAYRHQFIYIYPPFHDSGGKIWTAFVSLVITCMIVAEIVFTGWLGIKKAPISVGLMVGGFYMYLSYVRTLLPSILAQHFACVILLFVFDTQIPLIICTILFSLYVRQEHFHVTNHLPSEYCVEKDDENTQDGPMDYRFLKGAYLQAALKESARYPDGMPENLADFADAVQEDVETAVPETDNSAFVHDADLPS